jgi:hypothetical protein
MEANVRTSTRESSTGELDVSAFVGVWENTNRASAGIVRVQLASDGNGLTLRLFGAGASEPHDWKPTGAIPFADSPDLREATTFQASYRLGFMDVDVHAWIKLGVLVLVKFDRFVDESGRANRFSREFFYKAASPPNANPPS